MNIKPIYFNRSILCLAILFSGAFRMLTLASMREAPSKIKSPKNTLPVSVIKVKPENVCVTIKGYGEVKALDVVSIVSEVSGRIVKVHPKLEAGEILFKGGYNLVRLSLSTNSWEFPVHA